MLDVNDNNPVFLKTEYFGNISENTAPQSLVIINVTAHDPDLNRAGAIVYSMTSAGGLPFTINPLTGEIYATRALDFETTQQYTFRVSAANPQSASTGGTATVTVDVIDVNEYTPEFVSVPAGPVFIDPGLSKGSVVATVRATDRDGGTQGNITYTFDNEAPRNYFTINSSTGVITFKGARESSGSVAGSTSVVATVKRQADQSANYFPIEAIIRASDGGSLSDTTTLLFEVHNSYGNVMPTGEPSAPLGLLIGVVSGVVLAVIAIFVVIFVCAFVCRRRRHKNFKTGQIKDTGSLPMNNGVEMRHFSRQHSSQHSGSSSSSSRYHQTRIRGHEHSRISAGSIGSNSNRGSYAAYADDELESFAGENGAVYAPSLPRKSPSPTSDLASTVTTEILNGHSQEQPPYSKAQMAAIYAANREILENTGSQNSIHMFEEEGGGEGDGDMDVETMLFTKLTDFDDDDEDDDTDDDDDTTLPDDTNSYHDHQSMSGSGGNLTIPRPVEEHEDPFPYSPSQPKWAPQMKPMEAAIDDLHELAAYPSTDPEELPMHPQRMHYVYDHYHHHNHLSQGTPIYEPSAHEIMRHPAHMHHDPRPPPHPVGRKQEYGVYGTPPLDVRHPTRHMMHQSRPTGHGRPHQKRYGSAAELSLHYPHDIPPPRGYSGFSQEIPQYNLPSHYVPQLNTHTPSSSTNTPTEDGTVTPHTALTGDYIDQGYHFSSSSTSLSTQP